MRAGVGPGTGGAPEPGLTPRDLARARGYRK